nr:endolytic transglycosylase MltG [Nesterenkonia sp. Act20]
MSVAFGLFAVLVVGFVVVLQSLLGGDGPQDFETQAGENIEFTVQPGDGPIAVRGRLLEQGIIASADAFDDAYEQLEGTREVFEGEFPMREQMPAEDAVAILFDEEEAVDFIDLRAGMRIDAALSAIATGTGIPESDIRQAASDPSAYGLPEEATSLEGYLASGLYNPEVGAEPEDILQQMVDDTFARLEEAGVTEEDEQWETIIIASLLTAEGLPGDYEMIAGIIENRLDPSNDETGGLLQIDASVIYGLGTQSVQFTEEERRDASNPYNTYENPGLPPGPIAAPSEETIEAAGNPEASDNYYWITTNLETGETKFAETYEQHLEYVEEFNAYCEENAEICEGEPAQDNQGP